MSGKQRGRPCKVIARPENSLLDPGLILREAINARQTIDSSADEILFAELSINPGAQIGVTDDSVIVPGVIDGDVAPPATPATPAPPTLHQIILQRSNINQGRNE